MKYFINARRDRVGCQLTDELYAMYYCYQRGIDFVGAVSRNKNGDVEHNHKINMFNLPYRLYQNNQHIRNEHQGSPLQLLKSKLYSPVVGPKDKKHLRWFVKDDQFMSYLKKLFDEVRSIRKQQYTDPQNHHVVCHIRRGDVQPNRNCFRYFNNQYYIDILTEVLNDHPGATTTIHTYGKWNEPTQPFIDMGCKFVHVFGGNNWEHTSRAWIDMVFCDTLITSKSAFSYVPALFNNNTVIHTSTDEWQACDHWLTPNQL